MLKSKIEIFKSPNGAYFVGVGDRYEDGLTADEALFVVAQALIQPEVHHRWLSTEQEHFDRSTKNKWSIFRRDLRKPLLLTHKAGG